MRKIGMGLFIVFVLCFFAFSAFQMENLSKKISALTAKMDSITKKEETVSSAEDTRKSYEITIDMWQIFERELQDYKQRLKEGKQYFDEQKTGWNSILSDLKKSLQEYDKFTAAEGEFWEKQLKNYDKMLARTEERFEMLGQIVEELRTVVSEVYNLKLVQDVPVERREPEVVPQEERKAPPDEFQRITPSIKSERGEYTTYPAKEDQEGKKGQEGRETSNPVRGKISGSGDYRTY